MPPPSRAGLASRPRRRLRARRAAARPDDLERARGRRRSSTSSGSAGARQRRVPPGLHQPVHPRAARRAAPLVERARARHRQPAKARRERSRPSTRLDVTEPAAGCACRRSCVHSRARRARAVRRRPPPRRADSRARASSPSTAPTTSCSRASRRGRSSVEALRDFLGAAAARPRRHAGASRRAHRRRGAVLELLARGLDNHAIARAARQEREDGAQPGLDDLRQARRATRAPRRSCSAIGAAPAAADRARRRRTRSHAADAASRRLVSGQPPHAPRASRAK